MVAKSFIVLGLVLAVVLFISSEVAAKDLETVKGIEDDRGFNGGGRGGNGGFNNGGGRGGNGGFNNGGGRGGNGGFNGGGRGGNGGFNGGGRGGNGGFNGRYCRYGVCCRRGYCQCCYSAAEATTEAKP